MKIVISFIIGLLLFASVICLIAFMSLRPDGIDKIIAETDLSNVLDDNSLAQYIAAETNQFFSGLGGDPGGMGVPGVPGDQGYLGDPGDSIEGFGYYDAGAYPAYPAIGADDIRKLLNEEAVKAEITKVARRYFEAAARGDYGYHLSREEAVGIFRAVSPQIQEAFGYRLAEEDYGAIADYIDRNVDLRSLSVASFIDEAGADGALPNILFSGYPLAVSVVLCALFAFDAAYIHRSRIRLAFLNVGLPTALASSLYVVAGLALSAQYGASARGSWGAAAPLVAGAFTVALNYGLIFFGIGTVAVILHAVIHAALGSRVPPPRQTAAVGLTSMAAALIVMLVNCLAIFACGAMLLSAARPQA